jgi:ATP adenylyltransferase/5',5'''-P-1,P-4-tetraphosphate phosphorylase II
VRREVLTVPFDGRIQLICMTDYVDQCDPIQNLEPFAQAWQIPVTADNLVHFSSGDFAGAI